MSSSGTDKEVVENLDRILREINLYLGSAIFLFGTVGNILNIFILSQQSLRSNSCIKMFIAASTAGLIAIVSGLPFRILSYWDLDVTDDHQWLCKIRQFILTWSRSATFWLIMLATIDRWIVSSRNARLRRLSSNKNVFRSIFSIIFFTMAIHLNIFYCYKIIFSSTLNPARCFYSNPTCRLMSDLIFAIITILLPLILIFIFGLMTISNIRSSQSRVEPTGVSIISRPSHALESSRRRNNQHRKRDHSLLTMLFIQVILLAILTIPMAVQRLYSTARVNVEKSDLQTMIDKFFYQVTLLLTFIATGMQFYVNTFSGGTVFRKALIDFLRWIIRKIIGR